MVEHIQRGSISETAVTLDLLRRGFNVLMPTVVSRYDLLVEIGTGDFLRVQVKTARIDKRDGSLKVTWDRPYSAEEVDLFAVYDPTSSTIYYVPIEEVGPKGITIRLNRYKKHRKAGALKAEDYSDFPLERVI